MNHLFLAIAWTVFCILHSFFASRSVKQSAESWLGSRYKYYRLFYTLFALLSFTAVLVFQLSMESTLLYKPGLFVRIAGCLLLIPGSAIMAISIYKYFYRISGLFWLFKNDPGKKLLREGLHRFMRHPLYAGTFLFIWGLFVLFPYLSFLIANSIITIYTLIGIRFEEIKLRLEFGEDYRVYCEEVPMIIPQLRRKPNDEATPA